MAQVPTRILLVEDNEADYAIVEAYLQEVPGRRIQVDWVRDLPEAVGALERGGYDLCLCDYALGGETGAELVAWARSRDIEVPIIMLTGMTDRRVDLESMDKGATDFLVKDQLDPDRLERAIRYALARKALEDQLRRQALYDALTGLPRRSLLLRRVRAALSRARREPGYELAVLYLDLDRFKPINDELGHSFGDRLLQQVARRLEGCVEPADTVARQGGDEFIALLAGPGATRRARAVAEAILEAVARPVELPGAVVTTGASIGVRTCPEGDSTAEELLEQADAAMYRAKRAGRGRVAFHDPAAEDAPAAQALPAEAFERPGLALAAVRRLQADAPHALRVTLGDDGRIATLHDLFAAARRAGRTLVLGRAVAAAGLDALRRQPLPVELELDAALLATDRLPRMLPELVRHAPRLRFVLEAGPARRHLQALDPAWQDLLDRGAALVLTLVDEACAPGELADPDVAAIETTPDLARAERGPQAAVRAAWAALARALDRELVAPPIDLADDLLTARGFTARRLRPGDGPRHPAR